MPQNVPTHFNFARDVVDRWARERPDALALWSVREDDSVEEKRTFRQAAADSRRAASFFQQVGIHRGDRVLVILPRLPQWWIAMLGLIRLGAVPIPGTPMLTSGDLRYRIETAQANGIITDSDGAAKVQNFGGVRLLVDSPRPGWTDFDEGVRDASAAFDPEPTRSDDPGILYFTSGTTGFPKMVLHTQASYGLA